MTESEINKHDANTVLPQKEGYDLKFLGKRGWVYIK